jgi:hypothetical protein
VRNVCLQTGRYEIESIGTDVANDSPQFAQE